VDEVQDKIRVAAVLQMAKYKMKIRKKENCYWKQVRIRGNLPWGVICLIKTFPVVADEQITPEHTPKNIGKKVQLEVGHTGLSGETKKRSVGFHEQLSAKSGTNTKIFRGIPKKQNYWMALKELTHSFLHRHKKISETNPCTSNLPDSYHKIVFENGHIIRVGKMWQYGIKGNNAVRYQ